MNKEMEALKRLYDCNDDDYTLGYQQHDYELVKQTLYRLDIENAKLKRVFKIIVDKGFDKSIYDYGNYALWLEYATEQFGKAIEKNPTILSWDVFDKFIYTQEEFDLLRECVWHE